MLAIYRPDRKLAGTIGDGRALQMTPGPCRGRRSIKRTAGPYRQIPFPIRLQGPAVNPQDCRLYERRTPCPAVRTHPARDYSPPGPCRPPGTVGNTDCISYFGMAEVAGTLIKMDRWDVNQRDGAGVTPLIWAARYGHEEVVRLLLQKKDIQPDKQDAEYGRTALSWAAGNGHEGVVRLVLGPRFVNPGSVRRRWGKTARVLYRLFVNPDSSCECGQTPLLWAAEKGHEGIVRLLLGPNDVNPDSSGRHGRTPLSWAAGNGLEEVVRLLLIRQNVNPDTRDWRGGLTPLSWAAEKGHERIVKLLLRRKDVNPDAADTKYGLTPLYWATEKGHEGIVKLLLGQKGVDPDTPDAKYGLTPLSWAADKGSVLNGAVRPS